MRIRCILTTEELLQQGSHDLTGGREYEWIPDRRSDRHGLIRVIDDSDEDYLYPATWFEIGEKEYTGVHYRGEC